MKAIILAGGKGTRGKPYTEYFPKAMIPINGKPIVDYVVRYLKTFNFIKEIIIISDYEGLGGQIKNYYGSQKKDQIYSRFTNRYRRRFTSYRERDQRRIRIPIMVCRQSMCSGYKKNEKRIQRKK